MFVLLCLCICIADAKAWDFALPNQKGDTIYYSKYNSTSSFVKVAFPGDTSIVHSIDTLYIPETITVGDTLYTINAIEGNAMLYYGQIKVLVLPKTIRLDSYVGFYLLFALSLANDSITNFIVDDDNPYITSVDGVLYSKNLDSLLCFPMNRRGDYRIQSKASTICNGAFYRSILDSIDIPSTIKKIEPYSFLAVENLRSLRYPNSITRLDGGVLVYGLKLEEFIFGSGLSYIGGANFGSQLGVLKRIVCLAVTPPVTTVQQFYGSDSLTLFVPRKSIGLYRQAQGWSTFSAIEPIEPPVVSGVNNAEISWVTNAEASSYSLTLYLDSAQTRRLLTLTFDDRGYLQNMDINPDVYSSSGAPAFDAYAALSSMPNRVRQAHEEETPETEVNEEQFNPYLSFTVTGLRAGSEYFFVRRTYNALSEVIDEEQGSFETLPDTKTGLDKGNTPTDVTPTPASKHLREGQVIIVAPDGSTFTPDGKILKEQRPLR